MERKHCIFSIIKWFAFTLCSAGFLWKTSDSFLNYLSNDIGTKIELKENTKVELPAFAICQNFGSNPQKYSAKSLKYLNLYLEAKNSNSSVLNILENSLQNDSKFIGMPLTFLVKELAARWL